MTYTEEVMNSLRTRGPGLGGVVMLTETNLIDPATPVGEPLVVTGMGVGSGGITYKLVGWDTIGEEDPYYIVKSCRGEGVYRHHVMRMSLSHECFFTGASVERSVEENAIENGGDSDWC